MKLRLLTLVTKIFIMLLIILMGLLSPLLIFNWIITGKYSLDNILDILMNIENNIIGLTND